MKQIISLSLFTLILSFTACKKYKDGPWLSLRTAEARICGTWTIENYYENGVDLTTEFGKNPLYCSKYQFTNDELSATIAYNMVATGCKGGDETGWWDLTNDNKNLEWTMRLADNPQHPMEIYDSWKILRLTKKEFWLETEFNGITYEIQFKKD